MGCACHIVINHGDLALLELAERRVRALEDVWTRFHPGSELSRFNARAGHDARVSADLMILLRRSLAGFVITDGFFNPFLGRQIVAAGYDRDFAQLRAASAPSGQSAVMGRERVSGTRPSRSDRRLPLRLRYRPRSPLRLDRTTSIARLDSGTAIDSGGMGKGLGADLVAEELIRQGARGAMVCLGGDFAVRGAYPDAGWRIGIDNPYGGPDELAKVTLRTGGLCTSGILRRRWSGRGGQAQHHILDPKTGTPVNSGVNAVTTIAPAGWLAEAFAKAIVVGGAVAGERLLRRDPRCAALVSSAPGELVRLPASD